MDRSEWLTHVQMGHTGIIKRSINFSIDITIVCYHASKKISTVCHTAALTFQKWLAGLAALMGGFESYNGRIELKITRKSVVNLNLFQTG